MLLKTFRQTKSEMNMLKKKCDHSNKKKMVVAKKIVTTTMTKRMKELHETMNF